MLDKTALTRYREMERVAKELVRYKLKVCGVRTLTQYNAHIGTDYTMDVLVRRTIERNADKIRAEADRRIAWDNLTDRRIAHRLFGGR